MCQTLEVIIVFVPKMFQSLNSTTNHTLCTAKIGGGDPIPQAAIIHLHANSGCPSILLPLFIEEEDLGEFIS